MKHLLNTLAVVLLVLYPIGVYFGVKHYEPRLLGLFLLMVLLLRAALSFDAIKNAQGLSPLLAGAVLCFFITVFNNVFFLKLYPVLMSCIFLVVFSWTLVFPPSMIERIARVKYSYFSERGLTYTKVVTVIWCFFFAVNAVISAITIFLDISVWAFYNGFISYILMGVLFFGEWLVRQKVLKDEYAA